jgi:Bacterial Ig domain/Bacterial Ig-like domain/Chitobiase/beta-hexosaminidase C-terminal domain
MPPTPPLRPTRTGSADAEPVVVLRRSTPVWAAAAIAAAAAVFLAVVLIAGVGRFDGGVPGFLAEALGPEKAEAPLERTPATGVDVRIHNQGYTVSHRGASVSVASEDVGGAEWRRHVHGVTRETDFGTETIVADGRKTESFLTVVERQGERTWRWGLASRLEPRLSRDGAVTFLDPNRHLVTSITIDPVRILDVDGKDVTPDGLRWGLEEEGSGWFLTLDLDDRDLPLPYVIDPAVTHRTSATATTNGSTTLTIAKPTGTAEKDILIAHVGVRNNGTITPPAGWTEVVNDNYSFYLRHGIWYKVATASEPANYTWTFGTSGAGAGGISAFYGIKTTTAPGPVNVADTTTATANSGTVTATSITTTTANALVMAYFAARANTAFSAASGMSELYEARATGGGGMGVASDFMLQVAAGATGNKTSTITSNRNSGTQVSWNVDDINPTGSVVDPGTPLAGTVVIDGNAGDADSAVTSVAFQRSPANAGTWTTIGTDTTAPYSASFDTTAVSDGLYDLRLVVTDAAGNVLNSAILEDRRVDNTAPSSTTTFPASAGVYNSAGWAAGCATAGSCGTYADGGSGVSQVEISIRQGSGNYWSGGSFSSASEAWNTATIGGGNWSYGFAAGSFPADGGYTIRVRAIDAAGNVESPSSRSFTIDRAAPQTTIDSSPADPTASTSADFDFSSNEGGSTFECRLDGGSWNPCTSPESYTSLADGSHTFDVRTTDAAGNTDASPASYTWLVDTTAPSSTTTFPAVSGEYNASGWAAGCATAGLCGTYSDGAGSGVAEVEVAIRQGSGNYWDGSGFTSATEVWNDATLAAGDWTYALDPSDFPADGDYTVRVRAVDDVANTEPASSRTFTYDTTDPGAVFTFPASGGDYRDATWNAGCSTSGFCGTYSDAGSGVAGVEISIQRLSTGLYWDGSTFSAGGEVFHPTTIAGGDWSLAFGAGGFPVDGQYTVHVRATDDAGNTEGGPARTFRLDNTDPASTVTFPASTGTYTTAGWNAGCGTSGYCGTYSDDSGSGVSQVEVSIRQGSGNYWDGSGFSSGTEVWNAASLAGGDWSLAFPAGSFPADGDFTLRVRAADVAGNVEPASSRSFTIDRVAPQTTIDSSPADPTASTSADFDFSSNEGGSTFECRLGGGSWNACTSPESYTSLADGSHTFDVRATDAAGNTDGSPASFTWTVDTAGPSSTIGFPAASAAYNPAGWSAGCATAGLCGTYSDGSGSGVSQVEVSIRQGSGDYWDGSGFTSATEVWNDATLAAGDWAYAFDPSDFPADGDYTVRVRARDAAGNTEAASSRTFTFDSTEPETSIDSSMADPSNSTSATFDFSSDEPGSTFECAIDAGAWSPCTSPESYAGLSDGAHSFEVQATDLAGNTDGNPASFSWTIDTATPSSTATFPAASGSYTAAEWDAGCATAGLCGTYSDTGVGVIDVKVSIRQGAGNYWDGSGFTSATEVWNDASLAAGDWTYSFDSTDFPADGDYTVRVRARDAAGNTEAASSRTFTFDTTAPQTDIDSSPADPTASTSADFDFSADEGGSTFECRLDGGSWNACASPESYTGLGDGDHTFEVRATDVAGNTDASPASYTWLVDTSAPSSTIAFPAAGGEYNAAGWNAGYAVAGICGTYSDGSGSGVDQVQVSVRRVSTGLYWNGAEFSSATEVLLNTSLAAGDWARTFPASNFPADDDYTIRVLATDAVGNGEAPASRTFSFDDTNPTGSLTAPADGAFLAGTVAVSSDSADTGSGVDTAEFQTRPAGGGAWTTIDTDSTTPYTANWNTTPLADGDHDLRVITTDHAGNAFTSATRTVTVDNTAPSSATLDPLPAAIRNGHDLTGSGADATSGVDSLTYLYCEGASCTPATPIGSSTTGPDYSVTWTGQPADGDVRVLVRVTDRAGNTLDSAIQDVLVDNTDPSGSLTAPADGAFVAGTIAVSSDSADTGSGVDTAEFQTRPAGGGAWTTIDTDTTAPYTANWDTTPLADGDHDLRVITTDHAGNAFTSATRTVTVDNTAPSVTLTSPAGFVNAADPDPFTVTAASPDGDVQNVELFSCSDASAGCSGGSWLSLGVDASAPYSASWPVDPDGNRALRAVATDAAGNTGGDVVDVTIDRTGPSGSLTAPADGAFVAGTIAVSSDSADTGSGVDTAEFQTRPAGGGAWTTIDTDSTTPYTANWDTTPLADGDHDLRVVTADEAGNAFTSATRTVTVDNSAPSAPVVTLSESSPFAYVSGTEIFVNTDETGSYDVEATSTDPHSGIDRIRFPGPTDDSSSPYSATYAFADLSGPQTVTAFNGSGLTASSPFTATPDTAEPSGGSVDYPDGHDADGDITVAVDAGTDGLSGVNPASAVLERRTAALEEGACDPFAGGWSAVTSPDTVASGLCAQYRYRVSDRVGNEATYTSAHVVKVDLVPPGAPLLSLVETSPYAHVVGTEIFVNTNETGSYDVEASTSDAVSGIAKVVFPGGVEDTSDPYSTTYDFDDLLGTEIVTAHDGAGNTSSSDFDVTEDISAPSTTDDTASIGSAWQTSPVTVTLTPTDARSDVAATYYTTDGSVPTTSSDEGTSIDLTADGVYVIRYFSVDNVGNVEPVRTAFATIRIDQTNPGQPAITLDESSAYAHVSGAEIFVNTGQAGSYDVSATSSDAGSGTDHVSFPGGLDDTTDPYTATYDLDDLSGLQTVTAHDVAGNTASDTFTVTPDTAAPAGGSVAYPDGFDADGDVAISVDAGTDALSGVAPASAALERQTSALAGGVCDPFVGGWSAVTSPDTVPDSSCARYRYRVSDRVGNEAIYTSASIVKVDLTAPQTMIDVAPGDPSSDPSPSFEFSAGEPGSTFECRLDGGAWSSCSSPESLFGLGAGSHTFQVRATDAAGLTDPTPASHTWTVDTDAPATSLDDVPPDPSNDDAPTFEFSSNEPGSTFECRLDGGAWSACSSPETIGLLSDGSHTFEVRATDAAGNTDSSPSSHTWTVDTTAPDSSFTDVPGSPSNDATPTFEFSSSEPGSTFECRLDGGAWSACSSPEILGPLADGSHTFEVRATDAAGNQESAPALHAWDVDAGSPSVTITEPAGFVNASDADPYTVRATSPDDDVADVEFFRCSDSSAACATGSWVSLGSDATEPYEASWALDPDGNRALRTVVTDLASNTGADVVDVTVDRTVPATAVDSAPSDPSPSGSASFEFSAGESGVSFECRLDMGSWGSCSSPEAYVGLAEGSHTFHVRATDAAGNLDPTPATHTWTVDTVAPETTIDVAPGSPSGSASPSFEFSASEPGSTFECRLDGGSWDACSSPHAYAGLADGSHTFQVRATDAAGSVDPTPATHTWTIDATPPGGGLADPGQFLRGTVALSASPSDTGVGVESVDFQVSLADAGAWSSIDVDTTDPYEAAWDTTALADGAYDLRIVVADNAGNSSPSAVVEDRVVDNTAPGATMNDPGAHLRGTVSLTANATDSGSGIDTVSFQRSPAGAGAWTAVAASWDTTGVPDGLYDLRVVITDNAGNSTMSAPVTDRRVDNTKPSLTASTPADGSTLASAGSLEIVASEDVAGIVGAEIDGAAAPAPSISGDTVTYTQAFSPGPHLLAGELEDLAGNRQPIRVHFTTWTGVTTDYPYVEKNSFPAASMSLRSASDTTTVTVPAGAWNGAPAGDWLVLRIDPQDAGGASGGLQPASELLDVTAYWALSGGAVTSFSLPLEIEVDNAQDHVVPAVFESGAWRPLPEVPGAGLPASWGDGFAFDGSNVRILTRHLSLFALLEDVQPPTKPAGFKGIVKKGKFSLSWKAASDNFGLVSAYRIFTNGTLAKSVDGSKRSVAMGKFRLTDRRSFQVAAVDTAGNVGAKTRGLKVVPKLTRLAVAAAKASLVKRGFKAGKVMYRASAGIPAGRVIKGLVGGLRPAGSKVGLIVSKGGGTRRPVTPSSAPPAVGPTAYTPPTAPPPPAPTPPAPAPTTPPPAPTTAPPSIDVTEESFQGTRARVLPLVATQADGFSDLRRELGFGLLAAAFSIAAVAGFRARRPAPASQSANGDQMLLWDQRLIEAIRRFLRLS